MKVDTLYHYENFNAEYLTRTLSQGVIYCSNPSRFNDLW